MSRIFLPFASGHVVEIGVSLYKAPSDRSRLLDAYVTTECEGAVMRSARRAAEAVLNWLPPENHPKEPMVAAFDFRGLPTHQAVAGESGGLAMAIALASKFIQHQVPPIAATGILADSNAGTKLLGVQGISGKIEGALEILSPSYTILYPAANEREIRADLFDLAKNLSVGFQPCENLTEALNNLFDMVPPKEDGRNTIWVRWGLTAIFVGLIFVLFFIVLSGQKNEEAVLRASMNAQQEKKTQQPFVKDQDNLKRKTVSTGIIPDNVQGKQPEDVPSQNTSAPQKISPGKGFD